MASLLEQVVLRKMSDSAQREILFELGKLNSAQELILEGLRGHLKDDKENFSKITDKIVAIESKINYATGVIAVMIVFVTAAWNWILKKVGA